MDSLSVSIVIPLINEEKHVKTIINQCASLPVDEFLFVDGGSDDATCRILRDAGVPYIQSVPGRAVQMNAGAAESKSDILVFIHADTDIHSSHIGDVKAAMRDAAVVGGRFDIRLSGAHPAFRVIETMINLRSRLTKISTGDQAQFVRRAVFEKIGGFPDQALMEDVEFSRRLKKQGKIACLRRKITTSSRRWQKYGIVRTVLLMWRLRLLYWLGVSPERLAAMYREAR